ADLVPLVNDLARLLGQWDEEKAQEEKRDKWLKEGVDLGLIDPKTGQIKSNPGREAKQPEAKGGKTDPQDDDEGGGEAIPEPAEVVKAMEESWGGELAVPYLLQAGVKCWEVAFERLDSYEPKHKEAAEYFGKKMATMLNHFNYMDWAN